MAFEDVEDGEGSDMSEQEQHIDDLVDFTIPSSALFYRQLEWTSFRWPELQAAVNKLSSEDNSSNFLAWDFPQIRIAAVLPLIPSHKRPLS